MRRIAVPCLLLSAVLQGQPSPDIEKRAARAREENRIPEAIALYREAVSAKRDWTEGWWYLGTLLYDQERWTESRDALRSFLRIAPDSGPGHALLGLCLRRTGDLDGALRSLYRAQELRFGGNAAVQDAAEYQMIALLTHAGQFEEALGLAARYADRPGQRAPASAAAGLAALRRPLFPEDIPAKDKEFVEGVGRAVWDSLSRHGADAEQQYRSLIARYPGAPNLHYLYGSFLLQSRPADALAELRRELEIVPDSVPALVQLAAIHATAGDAAAALPYARKAAKAGPGLFSARAMLGRVLLMQGDAQGGIRELEAAKALAPASPDVRYALAQAYRTAGQPSRAAAEMAEFERLKASAAPRE